MDGLEVTLFGSGEARPSEPYAFEHVGNVPRERFESWPRVPVFRSEYAYEEFTFVGSLLTRYRPRNFDVTVTCSYPFTNWLLARRTSSGGRPAHVFVTQNGDYPAYGGRSEFRLFTCDGLVCTNPEYYERNRDRWPSALIPNGVDPTFFSPGLADREKLDLPTDAPLVLMVSALTPSKRVDAGIRAASRVEGLHLVVCGDGPERAAVRSLGAELMPGRFQCRTVSRELMPDMYRAADLFLHMSLDEPSANAYIEALAAGLPIVTHDRLVTRWTLEETAALVDATDEPQVAAGIREALGRRSSKEIEGRRDLVRRRFSWSTLARLYRAFFEEVLERRGS